MSLSITTSMTATAKGASCCKTFLASALLYACRNSSLRPSISRLRNATLVAVCTSGSSSTSSTRQTAAAVSSCSAAGSGSSAKKTSISLSSSAIIYFAFVIVCCLLLAACFAIHCLVQDCTKHPVRTYTLLCQHGLFKRYLFNWPEPVRQRAWPPARKPAVTG